MRLNIKGSNKGLDIKTMKKFILKLFPTAKVGNLTKVDMGYKLYLLNHNGKPITKAIVPPNVKDRSRLGYYCHEYNLCAIPLDNGNFIIKRISPSKALRPLFMLAGGYSREVS